MQELLRNDAKRQVRLGSIYLGITLLVFLSPFLFSFNFLNFFIIALPFFFIGIAMMSSAARDFRFSKLAEQQPEMVNPLSTEGWPMKMYLSTEVTYEHTGRLYDLHGDLYSYLKEDGPWYWKIATGIAAVLSAHPFAPRWFSYFDTRDQLKYKIEKKGGLKGRYFVKKPNGALAYYMEAVGRKGGGLTFYMYEQNRLLWQATTDKFMDSITVLDPEQLSVVEMKKDAIPLEAADRFGSKSGFLLQRYDQDSMPESLQLFLYMINQRRSM
ncbi:hypothetical protein N780_17935 [Pontibacillus chungwhensis BH030062]|uniref:Uncharacterized protein n=1 Tax=Pontibacillus chungwhensis BH030062 TaxID=1385513 RepID=A0A0A2UTV3_9BACI|nr:hypothetical protein [Pontibacillus chungwhensis]KGP91737.1 hypothetical protein N780_17935 [Pontibacillus chungwhensis BH030062]